MGLVHTIAKAVVFLGISSGPIMLACGLGYMECPDMLSKASGGTGPDKFVWAAGFTGLPVPQLLLITAAAKILALLDIFFLQVMPRFALLCVAIMMGAITYAHYLIPDDLPPPIVIGVMALVAAATWPAPYKKKRGGKRN